MHITAIFPGDAIVPELEPMVGLQPVVAAFFAVIVLEAVLLKLLRWNPSWLFCFLHSLAINVFTTLVGIALSLFVSQPLLMRQTGLDAFVTVLAVFCVGTIVIEGLLLYLLNSKNQSPLTRSLINALIINVASYVMLFALVIVVLQ